MKLIITRTIPAIDKLVPAFFLNVFIKFLYLQILKRIAKMRQHTLINNIKTKKTTLAELSSFHLITIREINNAYITLSIIYLPS